jgi:hypothetical protein
MLYIIVLKDPNSRKFIAHNDKVSECTKIGSGVIISDQEFRNLPQLETLETSKKKGVLFISKTQQIQLQNDIAIYI